LKNQSPDQRIKSFEKKQYIVSALTLLIFCGLAVVLNTLHLQSVAQDNTRFLSRMVKIGDFREASLILQEARLSNFTMIHYESELPERSFVLPPKAELFRQEGFWNSLVTDSISVPVTVSLSSNSSDKITFEFERFRFIPYAVLIWFILNLVSIPQTRFLKRRLIEQFHQDLELEKKVAKSEIAQQVRHNLRTPLAALMRIPKKLPDSVAKDRELLELTIGQIRELIAKLDDKPDERLSDKYEVDLYGTLVQAKRELSLYVSKSIDFQFEVDDAISSVFVTHVPFELRAILGNLVTNSIEALDMGGKIAIKAMDTGAEIEISVTDNGCGISQESLPRIFDKNFSSGKASGSGIGLSHAKQHLEEWGGLIHVESVLGIGTTLNIKLPVKDRAPWYLPRLKFSSNSKIYVLDDQHAGRELWRLKLEDTKLLNQTKFASRGHELVPFEGEIKSSPEQCTLLFDYDLGKGETGLQWLQRMPQAATRCLVTGHFDNEEVRAACVRAGVFLIPKSQIADIPFVVR
jgi:signal transduction histidine kinase